MNYPGGGIHFGDGENADIGDDDSLMGDVEGLTGSSHGFRFVALAVCFTADPSSFCRRHTPRPSISAVTNGPGHGIVVAACRPWLCATSIVAQHFVANVIGRCFSLDVERRLLLRLCCFDVLSRTI